MPPPNTKTVRPQHRLTFRADGVRYTLDRDEIGLGHERELFVEAGVTPDQAFKAFAGGARFGLAAVIWLARRQAGETVTYTAVEAAVEKALRAAGDDFDLAIIEEDGDDTPKARGGS